LDQPDFAFGIGIGGELRRDPNILMPSISKVGGPHSVGTSLISDVEKRATGSNVSPTQW
jgi:hypothetical protein